MTRLVDLPPEVLDNIFKYQPSADPDAPIVSNPVVQLWQCGSKQLGQKIIHGCTHLKLTAYRLRPVPRLPNMVYQLKNLTSFDLYSRIIPENLRLDQLRAPQKLQSLVLWLPYFTPPLESYFKQLDTLHPELKHIELNQNITDSDKFVNDVSCDWPKLPDTVTSISTMGVTFSPWTPNIITLPRQLQSWTDYRENVMYANCFDASACSELRMIDSTFAFNEIIPHDAQWLKQLPPGLEHINVQIQTAGSTVLSQLPRSLKTLNVNFASKSINLQHQLRLLPPRLTSLEIDKWCGTDSLITGPELKSLLPITLTLLRYASVSAWDDHTGCLDWSTMTHDCWPPQLKSLIVHKVKLPTLPDGDAVDLARHLPTTLTELDIEIVEITNCIFELPSRHFDSLITLRLHLQSRNLYFIATKLPHLTTLDVYSYETNHHGGQSLAQCYPRLIALTWSRPNVQCVLNTPLPPALKILKLRETAQSPHYSIASNPADWHVHPRLPSWQHVTSLTQLEKLSIRGIQFMWNTTCTIFCHLPSTLIYLDMCLSIHQPTAPPEDLHTALRRFSQLETLKMGIFPEQVDDTFNLSVTTLPSRLVKAHILGVNVIHHSTECMLPRLRSFMMSTSSRFTVPETDAFIKSAPCLANISYCQ